MYNNAGKRHQYININFVNITRMNLEILQKY